GSPEMVRAEFPHAKLVESGENAGFAKANNTAFAHCEREFFLLLNSDAFVQPGTIAALVDAAARHPRASVFGPRLLNADGSLQRSAWPFPSAGRQWLEALAIHRLLRRTPWCEDLGVWAHDCERSVDFLVGACLLVRSEVFEDVGG